ncbi:MAG: hypothetical protein R3D60_10825 [Paracoccaceae bacterium]
MNDRNFSVLAFTQLCYARPEDGARMLMSFGLSMLERWMVLACSVVVGVLIVFAVPLMMGYSGELFPPFAVAAQQIGANILAAWLITAGGRMFGGKGGFPDAILLLGALQGLTLWLLVAQTFVQIFAPALENLIVFAAILAFFWLLTGFVAALHGFTSRISVLSGLMLGAFAVGFFLSVVLWAIGVELPEMTNV